MDWKEVHSYMATIEKRQELLTISENRVSGNQTINSNDPMVDEITERLAKSKCAIKNIQKACKIGVVFAMWRESSRILPNSQINPSGEDCINDKLKSLHWLTEDSMVDWHVYAVDDNCPEESHKVAREVIQNSPLKHKITLLELAKGWPYGGLPLSEMKHLEESTKGGAIIYGLQTAIEDGCDFVCYTDCDNSVHIGEIGILLKSVLKGGTEQPAAFGKIVGGSQATLFHPSRSGSSPAGRLLSHVRKLVMEFEPPTNFMAVPFKLFRASYLENSLRRIKSFDFSFDQWLVLGLVADRVKASHHAFTFLDSYEESSWHWIEDPAVEFQKTIGLLQTLRGLSLPYQTSLAFALDKYIQSPKDIKTLYSEKPAWQMVEKVGSTGNPELMSLKEVIEYFEQVFSK